MDDKKILSDNNLKNLNFIKEINTYDIVDKNLNIKKENRIILIGIYGVAFICFLSLLFIEARKITSFTILLKMIVSYYIFSTWILMFLLIPIIKKKRTKLS